MTNSRRTGFVPLALSLLSLTACVEQGLDDGGTAAPFDPPSASADLPTRAGVGPAAAPTVPGVWAVVPGATLAVTVASAPTAKVGLEGRKADRDAKCEQRTIGACVIERCGAAPRTLPAGLPPVTIAVGDDEVAWLSDAQPTSELPPMAAGETVKVIGSGAAPVTFGAAMPADLELLEPTGPRLELSGASRQVVTWRPLADGVVSVSFASAVAPGYRRVTCDFPAAPGVGTIPAAILALFPPSGAAELTMSFMHQGLATGELEGLPTTLRLESRAIVLPVTYL